MALAAVQHRAVEASSLEMHTCTLTPELQAGAGEAEFCL